MSGTSIPGMTERLRGQTYDHVFAHPDREVGGVFVGTRLPGQPAAIRGIIPALAAPGSLTELTFTHEAWAQIHAYKDEHYADSDIVGWYHSHPGHGIFLSEHDLFIHRSFFADSSSIAFVVDPIRGEEGLFGWQDGEIVQISGSPTANPAVGYDGKAKPTRERPRAQRGVPASTPHKFTRLGQPDASAPTGRADARPGSSARAGEGYPMVGYLVAALIGVLLGVLLGLLVSGSDAAAADFVMTLTSAGALR